MNLRKLTIVTSFAVSFQSAGAQIQPYVPVKWSKFVQVKGHADQVPAQWLLEPEARIAHDLMLPPAAVPRTVPFNFTDAWWKSWLPGKRNVPTEYFLHLCETEAGDWVSKKKLNIDGIYFARPQSTPSTDMLTDRYGPEMPWIQRIFLITSDSARDHARWFINPPFTNFTFVEEPRRNVPWQEFNEPYVRLTNKEQEENLNSHSVRDQYFIPVEVFEVAKQKARYGLTWRGIVRSRDREHGIAGGELIVYDLDTREVLGVQRRFLIGGKNRRGRGDVVWEVASSCPKFLSKQTRSEFTDFADDLLRDDAESKKKRKCLRDC